MIIPGNIARGGGVDGAGEPDVAPFRLFFLIFFTVGSFVGEPPAEGVPDAPPVVDEDEEAAPSSIAFRFRGLPVAPLLFGPLLGLAGKFDGLGGRPAGRAGPLRGLGAATGLVARLPVPPASGLEARGPTLPAGVELRLPFFGAGLVAR